MSAFRDLSPDVQARIIRIGTWTGQYEAIERDLLALGVKPESCEQMRAVLIALHENVVAQVALNVALAADAVNFAA